MSSPTPTPGPPVEDTMSPPPEKKGLSKYVHRMKTVFKKGDSRRRSTVLSKPAQTAEASTATSATAPICSTGIPSAPTPANQQSTTDTPRAPTAGHQVMKVPRANIEQERARKLAEKYGLVLEPQDWKVHEVLDRVEKPIRMRIHRTCHKCSTTFGANRVCSSCEHTRCTKCPRYPLKKNKDSQPKETQEIPGNQGNDQTTSEAQKAGLSLDVDEEEELTEEQKSAVLKRKYRLTKPSRTGGQALVRKKPMQRVRRYCHECGTFFQPPTHICSKCGHERCTDCPRDPAKRHKYPDGYPGDTKLEPSTSTVATPAAMVERPIKQPRRLIRYKCHDCHVEYNTGSDICGQCQHQRCEECIKIGPKVLSQEEILTAEKMTGITFDNEAHALSEGVNFDRDEKS